jgi:hypothetical protein
MAKVISIQGMLIIIIVFVMDLYSSVSKAMNCRL